VCVWVGGGGGGGGYVAKGAKAVLIVKRVTIFLDILLIVCVQTKK
jgi:hypothetical protein